MAAAAAASSQDSGSLTLETLRQAAERLGESVDACTTVAGATAAAPNAAIVCTLLCRLHAQTAALTSAPRLRHQIKRSPDDGRVLLIVNHVPSLGSEQLKTLRQVSSRIHLVRFLFRSLETAAQLGYGCLVFVIGTEPLAGDELRALFVSPEQRQLPTVPVDWTDSVVAPADRALVMQVLDDVYNMAEFMPTDMRVALEAIENVDHKASLKKRTGPLASETDDESARPHGRTVGYALHFTGVPSFDDAFLAHMAHKYQARWAGFQLIFPHVRTRAGRQDTVLQQLVVHLSAETALLTGVQEQSGKGARLLARKLQRLAE